MSYFDDLLNRPLPSASGSDRLLEEDGDDIDFEKEFANVSKDFDADEECGDSEFDDSFGMDEDGVDDIAGGILGNDNETEIPEVDDDEDDDYDLGGDDEDDDDSEDDDDVDADLADLEREINVNGSLEGDPDNDHYIPQSVDDPTPAEPVEGQEDEDADRMLAICATPTVLGDTLTVEEAYNFIESGDAEILISEGMMMERDLTEMVSELSGDGSDFTEAVKFANPNQKYKMTKKARLRQLFELSLQIEARAHHDPYYPKIQKAYKIERTIKQGWRKRYGNLALKRAKKYLRALMNSKAPTAQKAAKRLTK